MKFPLAYPKEFFLFSFSIGKKQGTNPHFTRKLSHFCYFFLLLICREESFCDGTAPTCPLSQVKPNKTVCNKEFVCYKGECTGSICLAYGLESCQCTQGKIKVLPIISYIFHEKKGPFPVQTGNKPKISPGNKRECTGSICVTYGLESCQCT